MEAKGQLQISEGVVKEILWSVLFIFACSIFILYEKLWLRPQRIRSVLQKQGVNGPKPSFPFGNISEMQKQAIQQVPVSVEALDDWVPSLFPYFHTWRQLYGSMYLYSTGIKQHLYVGIPELIKWIGLHKSLDLGRPSHLTKTLKPMLGEGILRANGQDWAFQRNLIAPEFFHTKIKNMVDLMEESTMEIIRKWESHIKESEGGIVELVIDGDLKALTADVISKACFGISYAQGNLIFAKLATMQTALASPSILFGFLNLRFLPTKQNKEIRKLQKEVDTLILKVINDREAENQKSGTHENQKDLLSIILESAASANNGSEKGAFKNVNQLILDICKNIYFAGSETSAIATTWTLLLLALYPEWQQRVRSEIMETYDNMLPHSFHDMDKLRKLKALTMVIQESLRLYGPAVIAAREVLTEMKLGDHVLPKGINMWLFIPALHRDTDNWGPDAREFKPERFAGGVSAACKYPEAYIPFGLGSRICLGQNFALQEIKIIFCLLLSNFSFSLSPNYCHCPIYNMLLMPKYGVRLLVSKVHKSGA